MRVTFHVKYAQKRILYSTKITKIYKNNENRLTFFGHNSIVNIKERETFHARIGGHI